jgi:hypothetical protein
VAGVLRQEWAEFGAHTVERCSGSNRRVPRSDHFRRAEQHDTQACVDTRRPLDREYVTAAEHRSENVAFGAFSCATVPISSEGGPAKWLKIKNL